MGLRLYTGGTFDLFHSGHVEFLKKMQSNSRLCNCQLEHRRVYRGI